MVNLLQSDELAKQPKKQIIRFKTSNTTVKVRKILVFNVLLIQKQTHILVT